MRYPGWLLFVPLLGCSLPSPKPPSAEFLVADAGSTYWVRSGPRGISARTSPLILASANDRFYEVYVEEVTRSYEDALFTREPIYTRDLLTGRKSLLYEDVRISAWEKAYLTGNPGARLLDPEEDGEQEVAVAASGEADILAVAGPYVLYDHRATLERGDYQQSDSSRGALDIRSGKAVALTSVVRDTAIIGAGGVRERDAVRWRHGGYDVLARWDADKSESQMILRDFRGHEWPLGYVDARLPRIFWLDAPKVDSRIRSALATAFEAARSDDESTQLVRARKHRPRPDRRLAGLTRAAMIQAPALQ